jgi:hypothetical protein
MLTIRIKDGTASGTALCYSCTWAHVMKGFRQSEEAVYCLRPWPNVRVTFPVRECSNSGNRNQPTKDDMEEIASILQTKRIERNLGFVKLNPERMED